MDYIMKSTAILIVLLFAEASKVDRPRGVSLTKKVFYDKSKDFTCLDGSRSMPFSYVNDDYCDCSDGTDEPGTSACPNGQFHCTNAGFRPLNIPSSRVNDGICDCCDGSDEWSNQSLCSDNCKELWKAAREDLVRQAEAASRGVAIRKEYSERGTTKKLEGQNKLDTLKRDLEEIKQFEEELKMQKEEAEKMEMDAKDSEKLVWDNFKAKVQQQQESREAADAFTELDTNKDGSISMSELQVHAELDATPDDGVFTEEEVKAILGGESVEAPHFIEVTWAEIAGKFEHIPADEKDIQQPEIIDDNPDDLDDDEDDDDDDNDDDDDDDYRDDEDYERNYEDDLEEAARLDELNKLSEKSQDADPNENTAETKEEYPKINLPDEPVWSDAAKILIEAADKARGEYDDNQRRKSEAEREISSLEKELNMDFGPDEAFHELHGNCYELDTHEYTYKLCPFDKAIQKPKSGGSETSLGRWGSWYGPDGNKYSSMKYNNGLKCWNGPDRSTEVKISCGAENKLFSASEPSRCEYRFEFVTPAACEPVHVPEQPHDEL